MNASLKKLMCALALLPAGVQALDLPLASGARFSVPIASMKELRYKATVHQQFDFSCGSAALATLLSHHYGYPISEQEAFKAMFLSGDQAKIRREGFSLLDMQRFLASRGFKADGFQLPLEKLIDARLPAIVLVSEKGYHHFVVIKGAEDGRILLGDPSSGTRAVTRAHFEALWVNRLLFVIHGTPNKPGFNQLADWRAAPRAPLGDGVDRARPDLLALPKFGPSDF
jgi:predicted double-glycine peptidase